MDVEGTRRRLRKGYDCAAASTWTSHIEPANPAEGWKPDSQPHEHTAVHPVPGGQVISTSSWASTRPDRRGRAGPKDM